jgi:hypothetical protein
MRPQLGSQVETSTAFLYGLVNLRDDEVSPLLCIVTREDDEQSVDEDCAEFVIKDPLAAAGAAVLDTSATPSRRLAPAVGPGEVCVCGPRS